MKNNNSSITITKPISCPDFDLTSGDQVSPFKVTFNGYNYILSVKVTNSEDKDIIGEIADINLEDLL